jgi:hypothetical protein
VSHARDGERAVTTIPFASPLEREFVVNPTRIEAAIRKTLG